MPIRPFRLASLLVVLLGPAGPARAQSAKLLEAVKVHAPGARAMAAAELRACAQAGCSDVTRLRLLAGYLALADGDAAAAAELLGHKPPAGLEPWHAWYRGEAAFYLRDYAKAAKAFDESAASAPPSLRTRARARFGEAMLAAGAPAAALPALDEAVRVRATPELLHQRARAREAKGDAAGAKADRIALAVQHAAHPYGAEAAAALAKGKAYAFSFDERLRRADALLDAGDAEGSLTELDAAEKFGRDKARRGLLALARAKALFAAGRGKEAEEHLEKALKAPPPIAANAALFRAKRALKGKDRAAALEAMRDLLKKHAKQPAAEEAHFYVGWLELQLGRLPDAVKTFTEFAQKRPRSGRVDEVLWFRALAQLRIPEYAQAKATLEELQKRFPTSSLVPQAKYWANRAAQLGGAKPEEIAPPYEALVSAFPGSFYALLAQARLHDLGRSPPARFPDGVRPIEADVPKELRAALALSEAGLFRDASAEVDAQLSAVRTSAEALRFGHALQAIGQYGPAHALAARHLWGQAFGQREPSAVALFFPRAYRSAVEAEAGAQQIPSSLVWAIMRRESHFRADVASFADARGLMQILPRTAAAIARERGEEPPDADALFAPEINIRYGTWYLSKLWQRFRHPALAAAAYNAGPLPVLEWVNGGREVPLDLFVELIPYRETRGYVKQVVSDFHLYQALYGDRGAEKLALTLPEPGKDGVAF